MNNLYSRLIISSPAALMIWPSLISACLPYLHSITDSRHCFRTSTDSLGRDGNDRWNWQSFTEPNPKAMDDVSKWFHADVEKHKGQHTAPRESPDYLPWYEIEVLQTLFGILSTPKDTAQFHQWLSWPEVSAGCHTQCGTKDFWERECRGSTETTVMHSPCPVAIVDHPTSSCSTAFKTDDWSTSLPQHKGTAAYLHLLSSKWSEGFHSCYFPGWLYAELKANVKR